MPDPRTQIVADGYDALGEALAAWREETMDDPEPKGPASFQRVLACG